MSCTWSILVQAAFHCSIIIKWNHIFLDLFISIRSKSKWWTLYISLYSNDDSLCWGKLLQCSRINVQNFSQHTHFVLNEISLSYTPHFVPHTEAYLWKVFDGLQTADKIQEKLMINNSIVFSCVSAYNSLITRFSTVHCYLPHLICCRQMT